MGKKRWVMEECMHQLIGPWQNFGILYPDLRTSKNLEIFLWLTNSFEPPRGVLLTGSCLPLTPGWFLVMLAVLVEGFMVIRVMQQKPTGPCMARFFSEGFRTLREIPALWFIQTVLRPCFWGGYKHMYIFIHIRIHPAVVIAGLWHFGRNPFDLTWISWSIPTVLNLRRWRSTIKHPWISEPPENFNHAFDKAGNRWALSPPFIPPSLSGNHYAWYTHLCICVNID